MNTPTHTPEQLESIAKWANRYDITALLDAVTFLCGADSLRRSLLKCYFYIANQETHQDTDPDPGINGVLYDLQTLIEALDNTPEQPGPLRVVPADEARPDASAMRAELIEAKRRARHSLIEAGYWADSSGWLQQHAQLTDAEWERYREFRIRLGAAADKKKAETDKYTADNLEQLEREHQSTEAELWREIYRDLYQRTASQLTPEQQRAHQEMKERIELHTKRAAIMPTSHTVY